MHPGSSGWGPNHLSLCHPQETQSSQLLDSTWPNPVFCRQRGIAPADEKCLFLSAFQTAKSRCLNKKSNHIKPLNWLNSLMASHFSWIWSPFSYWGPPDYFLILYYTEFHSVPQKSSVFGGFGFFWGPTFHQYDYFFLEHISFSHPISKHVSIFYLATSSSNSLLCITWENIFKPLIRQRIMQLKQL